MVPSVRSPSLRVCPYGEILGEHLGQFLAMGAGRREGAEDERVRWEGDGEEGRGGLEVFELGSYWV